MFSYRQWMVETVVMKWKRYQLLSRDCWE